MSQAYYAPLNLLVGQSTVVSIDRADAPSIKGRVIKCNVFGCTILSNDGDTKTFIAFEHIRGVSESEKDQTMEGE